MYYLGYNECLEWLKFKEGDIQSRRQQLPSDSKSQDDSISSACETWRNPECEERQ